MTTWSERLRLAQEFEQNVAERFCENGWDVEPYGQALLSEKAREMLKRGSVVTPHRWLPDLLVARGERRLLIEAKTTFPNQASYSIEKDALAALREHERTAFMPLYVVFSDWKVTRVGDLWEFTDNTAVCRTGPQSQNGSGTPYWLFKKSAFKLTFDSSFGVIHPNQLTLV